MGYHQNDVCDRADREAFIRDNAVALVGQLEEQVRRLRAEVTRLLKSQGSLRQLVASERRRAKGDILFVMSLYRSAVNMIIKDEHYPCQCGTGPYTDGEPCPKCFAVRILEALSQKGEQK